MGEGYCRQRGPKVGGDDFLVVESDHSHVIGDGQSVFPKAVVQAHGHTVVVAVDGGDTALQEFLGRPVSAFLVGIGFQDQVRIERDACASKRFPVAVEPSRLWRGRGWWR